MRTFALLLIAALYCGTSFAQTGVGTSSPHSSAELDVQSISKGLLPPRMSAVQRTNIASPANGLMVFDTDSTSLFIYNGPLAVWQKIRPISNFETLIAGTSAGDVLLWNGSAWVVTPKCNLFTNFYRDRDGDGFGDPFTPYLGCTAPSGFVSLNTDCNDTNAVVKPGATEICNGKDDDCDGLVDEGFNISTDPNNCGGCGIVCPTSVVNGTASCSGGNCNITCNAGFANCDGITANGCEVQLSTNVNHCGACNSVCSFPNAVAACIGGACSIASCLPGFVNLDNNIVNGCECAITNPNDMPDATAFMDTNCDGIDGTESNAVFVAPGGNNGNPGTKNLPKQTITAAIITASAQNKKQILIAAGTYNEAVTLTNGISLFGGYTAGTWVRSASNIVVVTGGVMPSVNHRFGIQGTNLTDTTFIDRVTITTANATIAGTNNYGIYCVNCPKLIVRNCIITAGNGAAGTSGNVGIAGSLGGHGSQGTQGSCSGFSGGGGGAGGSSTCSRNGGAGGAGGAPSAAGANGSFGAGSTAGGTGGSSSTQGQPGMAGLGGSDGANGNHGASAVASISSHFAAGAGGNGTSGTHGNGGGGGGGGGGEDCPSPFGCSEGTGNGGGGGGAGGCLGTGGNGGNGGGGSFGVYLFASAGAIVTNSAATAGNGGAGGNGGNGGQGGAGGNGGTGNNFCVSDVGAGGNGGNGGNGGHGGAGAGGNGGYSVGIFSKSGTPILTTIIITIGFSGSAGSGGTNPVGNAPNGTPGIASSTIDQP